MTDEEKAKFKRIIDYFGSWYDVIGLDNIKILEKSISYIAELEKENAELKSHLQTVTENRDELLEVIERLEECCAELRECY